MDFYPGSLSSAPDSDVQLPAEHLYLSVTQAFIFHAHQLKSAFPASPLSVDRRWPLHGVTALEADYLGLWPGSAALQLVNYFGKVIKFFVSWFSKCG